MLTALSTASDFQSWVRSDRSGDCWKDHFSRNNFLSVHVTRLACLHAHLQILEINEVVKRIRNRAVEHLV